MNCTIKINMDNSAFDDSKADELQRILHELANDIACNTIEEYDSFSIRDINGNKIGECIIE
jgi:hypothetical protein